MDRQTLSRRLDTLIAEYLEQKRHELNAGRKKVHVVITGDDLSTLSTTLLSLVALDRAGYQLLVTFSHSASLSGLKTACVNGVEFGCTGALFTEQWPIAGDDDCSSLFLPALSTNSLSKIALGIRDNIASTRVFHALNRQMQVIVTLNPECLSSDNSGFVPPLLACLAGYVATLEKYGIVIAGKNMPGAATSHIGNTGKLVSLQKSLITLSDIRQLPRSEGLRINSHTLITPAAQDEIRRQNITVIQGS